MILLLSCGDDTNLDHVIEWLHFYRHPYLRINSDDLLNDGVHLTLPGPRLVVGQREIELDRVGAIWLRRFGSFRGSPYWQDRERHVRPDALQQLANEHSAMLRGVMAILADKYWLTDPRRTGVNKLDVLLRARQCGFTVPDTHVINRKCDLLALLRGGRFICKSLHEPMFVREDDGLYTMFTTEIDSADGDLVDDDFAPSLVQRLVPKQYELRVFYLDGECYTMATFSQQRQRSALDFRNIDWADPPRQVPYQLPRQVAEHVHSLMTALGLNSGSLDIIKGTDDRYYFLEVNPIGQFGMVAFPCNYPLFEKVALHLIQHDQA